MASAMSEEVLRAGNNISTHNVRLRGEDIEVELGVIDLADTHLPAHSTNPTTMIASNRKVPLTTTLLFRATLEGGAGRRRSCISLRNGSISLRKAVRFSSPSSISFQLLESFFGPGTKPAA